MTDVFEIVEEDLPDNVDYLAELVGEGKKFADPKALAKGKAESDKFIERLIAEKEAMRKELDARLTAEEIFTKLQDATKPPAPPPNNQTVQPPSPNVDVNKLVEEKFQQLERTQKQDANEKFTLERLQENLGSDFKIKVNARARELGVGPEFVRDLMRTNPNAALALFEATSKRDVFPTPPNSRINTTSFDTRLRQEKKFKDYEKIRKEDPRTYYSAQVQQEMFKQLEIQGEDFYK